MKKGGFLWLKNLSSDGVVRQYLATSKKTLAVVGLSDREETTSNRVTKEMHTVAIKLFQLTRKLRRWWDWGERLMPVQLSKFLSVDIVNVYRRSEFTGCSVIFSKRMPRFLAQLGAWKSGSRSVLHVLGMRTSWWTVVLRENIHV